MRAVATERAMSDMALTWNLTTLAVLSLGGPVVGFAVFRKWHWLGLGVAFLVATWAGAAAAIGQTSYGWWSCGGLALAYLVGAAARRWVGVPRFKGAALARVFGTTAVWACFFGVAG